MLLRVADELKRRQGEIACTITLENGKPLAQSKGEVAMAKDHLRWFAEEGKRAYGRVIPQQDSRKRNLAIKSPIGPVGAIAPWNFPLALSVRKAAPALAAGLPRDSEARFKDSTLCNRVGGMHGGRPNSCRSIFNWPSAMRR